MSWAEIVASITSPAVLTFAGVIVTAIVAAAGTFLGVVLNNGTTRRKDIMTSFEQRVTAFTDQLQEERDAQHKRIVDLEVQIDKHRHTIERLFNEGEIDRIELRASRRRIDTLTAALRKAGVAVPQDD